MYHISHKVVLHLGSYFVFMRGVMYSGGLETSHGDSWIMALIFYLFIVYKTTMYPHIREAVYYFTERGWIRIAVYGDDHIWCCPKVFREIINVKEFARFLSEVIHMNLRDAAEYDSFLSVVNFTTGEFVKKGPVFLKRRFIESNDPSISTVVSYKSTSEIMVSLLTKEHDQKLNVSYDPVDMMLSCIGQAYDTYGTNVLAYHFVSETYKAIGLRFPIVMPHLAIRDCLNDPSKRIKINRLMRRVGMSEKEVFFSFSYSTSS